MEIINVTDIEFLIKMRFDYFATDNHMPEGNREVLISSLRNYFEKHVEKDFIAIAVKEKEKIVSVGYMVINEMPGNGTAPNGLTGTLLNILTYPEYQGKGYASILIKALIEEAIKRNLSFIDLYATEQGIGLYEKFNFKKIDYQAMRLKL